MSSADPPPPVRGGARSARSGPRIAVEQQTRGHDAGNDQAGAEQEKKRHQRPAAGRAILLPGHARIALLALRRRQTLIVCSELDRAKHDGTPPRPARVHRAFPARKDLSKKRAMFNPRSGFGISRPWPAQTDSGRQVADLRSPRRNIAGDGTFTRLASWTSPPTRLMTACAAAIRRGDNASGRRAGRCLRRTCDATCSSSAAASPAPSWPSI